VTSCCSDDSFAPHRFTILGLFNIFRPCRNFGAFFAWLLENVNKFQNVGRETGLEVSHELFACCLLMAHQKPTHFAGNY
jgi:hypothetical protein